MESIMKEILHGNRGQAELIGKTEKYRELITEVEKLYDMIDKKLSDKDRLLFKKFCELHGDTESESADIYFTEGMKLGIRLGIEICD